MSAGDARCGPGGPTREDAHRGPDGIDVAMPKAGARRAQRIDAGDHPEPFELDQFTHDEGLAQLGEAFEDIQHPDGWFAHRVSPIVINGDEVVDGPAGANPWKLR